MHFSDYMSQWLYGEDGYYSKYRAIGKSGDFYTAVSTSKFFGGSIANHIISRVDDGFLAKNSLICEIGAHHGYLLADIIEFIYTLRPQLLKTLRFATIERFELLRKSQREYFRESFGEAIELEQYSSPNELSENSIFYISNEIFDAFSCELFYKGKIATVTEHKIEFNIEDSNISDLAKKYNQDRGEIAIGYEDFAQSIYKSAKKIEFMSFDYGELAARSDFSIRIYKNHNTYPLFDEILLADYFKDSDITYDVNFSHVKDAFLASGFVLADYKTQLVALVDMGIITLLDMLRENSSEQIYIQELEKVKTLITPSVLGERFKMIRFIKC